MGITAQAWDRLCLLRYNHRLHLCPAAVAAAHLLLATRYELP